VALGGRTSWEGGRPTTTMVGIQSHATETCIKHGKLFDFLAFQCCDNTVNTCACGLNRSDRFCVLLLVSVYGTVCLRIVAEPTITQINHLCRPRKNTSHRKNTSPLRGAQLDGRMCIAQAPSLARAVI